MRFAVLGPLEASTDRRLDPDRPAQRRLLAILLLHAGEPVSTDVLIDRFWGEDAPRTARAALQTHLAALRRRLGRNLVRTTPTGYVLRLEGHERDIDAFDWLADAARRASDDGSWSEAAERAGEALALWRGDPYPDLGGDDFAQPEIARLEELRMELVELRASALLAMGRPEQALPDLDAAVAEEPIRERLTELIMLARARSGRPTDALDAYRRLRASLSEMGLEPRPTLRELEERILREDPALVPPRIRHNLPALDTTFVGREKEMNELVHLLDRHRLVTVTGVGGTGKTRLGIEVAHRMLERFPDGVYMVELAGLTDPELVGTEVASALGLRAERRPTLEVIADALRQQAMLILLDNCEHLIDVASQLAMTIVEAVTTSSVLATTREPFGVPAERVFDVPPLSLPHEAEADPLALRKSEAVRLFEDRALQADPEFVLGPQTAPAVAAVCRQLDGLPLAIELAAARVRSLPVDAIAAHLDDLGSLAIGVRHGAERRQRTLEATIDWSYQLLDDRQRSLLRRLSVFRSGFDLEAAERICGDRALPPAEVAGLVSRLVDQSLLGRDRPTAPNRYRLLDTIRRFARTRLASEGIADELARRHRDWYLGLAEAAGAHLEDEAQSTWFARVAADRENLDAALEHSVADGDRAATARIAEVLAWYHARLAQYGRAITEMRIALEHLDETAEPERAAAIRARLAGTFYSSGDEQDAMAQARHAVDLVAERRPSPAKVRALSELASLHLRIVQQDPQQAIDAARRALTAADGTGDRTAQVHALRTLGTGLCWAGEIEAGIAQLRQALAIGTAIGNSTAILGVYMRLYISLVDFARDDDEAARTAEEALGWLDRDGGTWGQTTNLLMWFAYGFMRGGRFHRADEMLDRSATYHIEGMSAMSYHSLRGMLRWMQGRLTEAQTESRHLRATGPRPRYYRLLYPLEAEIAADEGRLDDVRRLADEHLESVVIPAEEGTKAGTLRALVRAEIDAAAQTRAQRASAHLQRAKRAVAEIHRLVADHPTEALSGIQFEPPPTYAALAEAELARGTNAAPDAWRSVLDRPLFAYWRTYARWRLGEALLSAGHDDAAARELQGARDLASTLGATLLRGRVDATARRAKVNLRAS